MNETWFTIHLLMDVYELTRDEAESVASAYLDGMSIEDALQELKR